MDQKQRLSLKRRAHSLNPIVIIGQHGLTDAVLSEINEALFVHELIKVRVNAADHDERDQMIEKMCNELHATLIQEIGHIAVLYRKAEKDKKSGKKK